MLKVYNSEFCARVRELGMQGRVRVQMASDLQVPLYEFDRWIDVHEEFKEEVHQAETDISAYWKYIEQNQKLGIK